MWLTTLTFYLFILIGGAHLLRKNLRNRQTAKLKHCGFYSIGGEFFSLKKWLMYCLLWLRAWRQRQKPIRVWDRELLQQWEESEKPQQLDQNDKDSIDSVYFYGGELESDKPAIVIRMARRPDRVAELWFLVRMPDGTILEHPVQPNTHVTNCSPDTFSAGGFTITCDEPMNYWSLRYHGLMKRGIADQLEPQATSHNLDDYVTVNLRAKFRASVNPFDAKTDLSPKIVAEFLAREPWSSAFFAKLKRNEEQVHLEQWGMLTGEMTVGTQRYDLNMSAYRDHSYGLRNWRQYYRYAAHFGYLENGSFFSFGSVSIPQTTTHVKYGYIYLPYGKKCAIDGHDLNLWEKGEITEPPKNYQVRLIANGKDYKVEVRAGENIPLYVQSASCVLFERFTEFTVNGIRGWGITEYCYWHHSPLEGTPEGSLPMPIVPGALSNEDTLVVDLDQQDCCVRSLTGGKGSQLAVASKIFNESGRSDVRVPKGFVVTTNAYREFIQANTVLWEGINELRAAATSGKGGSLEPACKSLIKAFASATLPASVTEVVMNSLDRIFSGESEIRFAVRSSGVSEDGSSASSAGQMETFLGVNRDELPVKIVECWASLFCHRAVQYRHSVGQGIDASMAVVVQGMVPATAAGVLFSQDPISGCSSLMKIEANFGLGESVVSGLVTPDSFTVRRFPDGYKTIEDRQLGEKSEVMQVGESGGLETRHSDEKVSSLSDKRVLALAELGEELEKRYGAAVDVEFALVDDTIHLLQVRPVTAMGPETLDDVMHEFDSSFSYKEGWLTTANIGEMSPGAMTPLTLSTFGRAVDWSMIKYKATKSGIVPEISRPMSGLACSANHLLINMMELGLGSEVMSLFGKFDMACIALLGRTLDEPTRDDLRRYTDGEANLLDKIWNAVCDILTIYQSTKLTEAWEKKFQDGYHVMPQYTAKEQYMELDSRMPDYAQCWCDTIINTGKSAVNSMVLVSIFNEQFGLNEQTFSKLALCLSNCENVYSADVPTALHNLAVDLSNSPNCSAFLALSPKDAANWLLSYESGKAGESFRSFINRHGFRCIREAEFREVSWRAAPEKIVAIMQATISAGLVRREAKETLTIDEIVEQLELRNPLTRRLVKALIPLARRGVASREWGKAISIRMVDAIKEGYKHLGQLMVKEELAPDTDLVYFFTHRELGLLVDRKDTSSLIKKALKRRAALPRQNALQLPELIKGNPRFDLLAEQERPRSPPGARRGSGEQLSVAGMPVSRGSVTGRARVIRNLQDAAEIEKDDVLIVPYTDVGWTPYFPLISGLATEKGGLLSHGAVVAREFGIPCIVGAKQATSLFKTGDFVDLDGERGLLRLAEQQQE
ncbi:hypothetical protein BOX15_Mlig003482g1 [Macrostomum lignano]|uniref:Phosphoenolpyruvate synthase n=1 Tax=Macrostomum lignano TaxID=282301 RepID=A0A267GV68_9PLAT|nr:hypothetical protein BOX15_Mlig003482g1 [Macrostomum lignano]